MTTEMVLLFTLVVAVLTGSFFKHFGDDGFFQKSGPRLAARLERNISTGQGFKGPSGGIKWIIPPQTDKASSTGQLN